MQIVIDASDAVHSFWICMFFLMFLLVFAIYVNIAKIILLGLPPTFQAGHVSFKSRRDICPSVPAGHVYFRPGGTSVISVQVGHMSFRPGGTHVLQVQA